MNESTEKEYKERILRVLIYIQDKMDLELSLEELAGVACFSKYHFHRIFKAMVGESVYAHIRRLRLERSIQRLLFTDMSIIEIALEIGYESHEAYTRAFKEMFDMSPSEYRNSKSKSKAEILERNLFTTKRQELFLNAKQERMAEMEVKIEERQPTTVAFVRNIGPYNECKQAWEKLCQWAGPKGLLRPDCQWIGICYDDPDVTPEDKIRYDACINVPDGTKGEGDVGVQEVTGGQYATATLKGPYDGLKDLYSFLYGQWLPGSEYQCRDLPPLEQYLNSPDQVPPAELLTKIWIPIEPKK